MTVSSTTNKSGPYLGNGTTVDFDYEFRILDPSHVTVVMTEDGVDTTVSPSDYTVSGVGASVGGTLTFLTAPATGQSITIIRNAPFTQPTDLENQGAYYAETVEGALDLGVMRDQQLAEGLSRAVQIPVGADTGTLASLIEDIVRLGDSADEIDTVAGIAANVTTVAGISANVTTVAGIAADVSAVAAIAADVSAVENIAASVVTVAGIAAAVADVSAISAEVEAAAAIAADVTTVADNIAAVNTAATNIAAIVAAPGHASSASTSASTATAQASNASTSATAASNSASAAANSVASLPYTFSTTTTDADPGAGLFRLNNAAPGSATAAYIDNTDADGVAATGVLDTWDDSTSPVRGVLTIRSKTNAAIRHTFNVTGSVVDGTGYRKLTLAYLGGAGTLSNGSAHWLVFDRTGDAGAGSGDFSGPGISVTDNIVTFSNTGGKTGKDSGVAIGSVLREVSLSTGASAAANAATLQAAINAASNTTLYLPAGSFQMNAVTLKPGVRLQGKGKEVTRLLCGSNSISMLSYTAATTQFYFAIRDIGFEVNSKTGATAISIDGATSAIRVSNVSLWGIEISGAFAQGVDLRFCANSNLTDVFTSLAVSGFVIDNCADTDLLGCKAQNGSGSGFTVVGGAGMFDEGVRLVACSTNGQTYGLIIDGQDWGLASACSFTTCPGGALLTTNSVSNWKFSACDFATAGVTPAAANATLAATTSGFSFAGCQFILGTFGIVMGGTDHTISGCTFHANSNVDIYLNAATGCTVVGNMCKSTTASWSILEVGASDNNTIRANGVAALIATVFGNSSSKGVAPDIQFTCMSGAEARANVSTAQSVFFAAGDTIALDNNTSYFFEAVYFISRSAGTTSHTTGVLFAGTATFTSVGYLAQVTNPTGNVLSAVQQLWASAATEVVLTAANTSATENLMIKLSGVIRTNAAGTLVPQFKYSAAPGGAPTVGANSYFKIWKAGSETVLTAGDWN